jgi:hypothetical protein
LQYLVAFQPDALAWDGVFYYSYARSAVLDGDLEFANDISLSYRVTPGMDFVSMDFHEVKTATGRTANPFAPGTGILWLPTYVAVAAATRVAGAGALTGYEIALRWTTAAVSAGYGLGAILVAWRLAKRATGRWAAGLASATLMFSTPMLYYQFREPFYSHCASAMMVGLFVVSWWQAAEAAHRAPISGLLLGVIGGTAAIVRTQNAVYLVLPLLTGLMRAAGAARRSDVRALRATLAWLAYVGAAAIAVLSVQLAVWRVLYGRWLALPQGPTFMDWRAPWVLPLLLSSYKGLLPWMPVVVPGTLGLLLLARRRPHVAVPLLIALCLQVYVNACVNDWFGGGGYGPRRFTGTVTILLVGYAALVGFRRETGYRLGMVAVSAALATHQWLLICRGFVDEIGGRFIRMSAPPLWEETGLRVFAGRLLGYVPEVARDPGAHLVLPGSPIALAGYSPRAAAGQALLLGAILAAVIGVGALVVRCRHDAGSMGDRRVAIALPAAVLAAVILGDAWILLCA